MPNKKKQNINLIPQQMILGHIKDMCLSKVLIMILVFSVLGTTYYFGCQAVSNKLRTKADEIERGSAYNQTVTLQEQINSLNDEINTVQRQIQNTEFRINEISEVSERNTKIHEITNFIVTNKPNNITLIMLEDAGTGDMYNNSGIQEQLKTESETTTNSITGQEETAENPEQTPEETLGYNPDMLVNNGEGLNNVLKFRGFAVDRAVLSEFVNKLNECESIESYKVQAIETEAVLDYSINLFSIEITF